MEPSCGTPVPVTGRGIELVGPVLQCLAEQEDSREWQQWFWESEAIFCMELPCSLGGTCKQSLGVQPVGTTRALLASNKNLKINQSLYRK